jgi:hypothetical protein
MLTALLIAGVTYIVIKAVQKAVEEGTRRGRADEPRPLPVTRRGYGWHNPNDKRAD